MSYGGVENTAEELALLAGAKIVSAKIKPDGFGDTKIVLAARLPNAITDQHGCTSKDVEFEVWQDEEGNGPGYIALTKVGRP